jgi:hypothetical protein
MRSRPAHLRLAPAADDEQQLEWKLLLPWEDVPPAALLVAHCDTLSGSLSAGRRRDVDTHSGRREPLRWPILQAVEKMDLRMVGTCRCWIAWRPG